MMMMMIYLLLHLGYILKLEMRCKIYPSLLNISAIFFFMVKKHAEFCSYMVWQISNETDFLLTMNFILFTNQGYPLQNSSLGQLHSDRGVVSIVRSNAGRLLLL